MALSQRPLSLSIDSHGGVLRCAACSSFLLNPSQLPGCLHILCGTCMKSLEAEEGQTNHRIHCPKCGEENILVNVLQRISGLANTFQRSKECDECQEENAMWNCFNCGKNLCTKCRIHHPVDHTLVMLLSTHDAKADLAKATFDESRTEVEVEEGHSLMSALSVGTTGSIDTEDFPDTVFTGDGSSTGSNIRCPLCSENSGSCEHVTMLLDLQKDTTQPEEKLCQMPGHVEDCNPHQQRKLKYFCKKPECWILVCGQCSKEGTHKKHTTPNLSDMSKFLGEQQKLVLAKAEMLYLNTSAVEKKEKIHQNRLQEHLSEISDELHERKCMILEETELAFARAFKNAKEQGTDILNQYKERCVKMCQFMDFLNRVTETVNKLKVTGKDIDETGDLDIAKYITAFRGHKIATELLSCLEEGLKNIDKTVERRLVLMEREKSPPPPSPLARVGAEWCPLRLAFTFDLESRVYTVTSIVVTGSDSCIMSCVMAGESDAIICHQRGEEPLITETKKGKYFLAQLKASKDIVASYTKREDQRSAVQYRRHTVFENEKDEFQTITESDFPTKGIATTPENNILVCVDAGVMKGQKECAGYLMLMNLQGKEVRSSMKYAGANMLGLDYVAASDQGDVCVSDTDGGAVVILGKDLKIKERLMLKEGVPTRVGSETTFRPQGICYDSYGRIIVADPDSHSVVRLTRMGHREGSGYRMEPLLSQGRGEDNFAYPKLVALGPDSRLWVVCRSSVFVYEYCS